MSRVNKIFLILCLIMGVPVAIATIFINLLISPVGGGLGILFGLLYGILGVFLFWPLLPRHLGYILSCLVWGGGVCMAVVMVPSFALSEAIGDLGWTPFVSSFAGAYPEEIAKAIGIVVILFAFRRLTRPWHGFVTGGLVGLGFEVVENILYGAVGSTLDPNSDLDGVLYMWGIRSVAAPFMHVVFSSVVGWGIGLAIFVVGKKWAALYGLLGGFALHFLWNVSFPSEAMQIPWLIAVALVMYAVFGWIYYRAIKMARADDSYVYLPAPITTYRRRSSSSDLDSTVPIS